MPGSTIGRPAPALATEPRSRCERVKSSQQSAIGDSAHLAVGGGRDEDAQRVLAQRAPARLGSRRRGSAGRRTPAAPRACPARAPGCRRARSRRPAPGRRSRSSRCSASRSRSATRRTSLASVPAPVEARGVKPRAVVPARDVRRIEEHLPGHVAEPDPGLGRDRLAGRAQQPGVVDGRRLDERRAEVEVGVHEDRLDDRGDRAAAGDVDRLERGLGRGVRRARDEVRPQLEHEERAVVRVLEHERARVAPVEVAAARVRRCPPTATSSRCRSASRRSGSSRSRRGRASRRASR